MSSEFLPSLDEVESLESDEDQPKVLLDDSPYEEVRAAVSNTDDPEMACVVSVLTLLNHRKRSVSGLLEVSLQS